MPRARTPRREPAADAERAGLEVARRIASLRAEHGLTLRELGARAGLSEAYLSRVENGRAALTIAGLARVSAALGVPLEAFFRADHSRPLLVVTRAGGGTTVRFRGRQGYLTRLLAGDRSGKLMEPILVDAATAARPVPLLSHAGEEFLYALDAVDVVLGDDRVRLAPGDCVYFDAAIPHAIAAPGRGPARALSVVTSRDYALHSNIAVLLEGNPS